MGRKKPDKRRHNESAYVNRGVGANLNEFWDEEGAREVEEQTSMLTPPPGWSTCESQSLYKPWTGERVAQVTHSHETEEGAVAESWKRYQESEEGLQEAVRRIAALEVQVRCAVNCLVAYRIADPTEVCESALDILDPGWKKG